MLPVSPYVILLNPVKLKTLVVSTWRWWAGVFCGTWNAESCNGV